MSKAFTTLPQIDLLKLNHASTIPIDNFCRRMIRLCNIVKAYGATGKMIQMGVQLGGKGVGKLVGILSVVTTFNRSGWNTELFILTVGSSGYYVRSVPCWYGRHPKRNDLYLNQVPHSKYHHRCLTRANASAIPRNNDGCHFWHGQRLNYIGTLFTFSGGEMSFLNDRESIPVKKRYINDFEEHLISLITF